MVLGLDNSVIGSTVPGSSSSSSSSRLWRQLDSRQWRPLVSLSLRFYKSRENMQPLTALVVSLLLARLQIVYREAVMFCLLASVVVCNTPRRRICNVTHQGAARDGGPVVLRPVRATPRFSSKFRYYRHIRVQYRVFFTPRIANNNVSVEVLKRTVCWWTAAGRCRGLRLQ